MLLCRRGTITEGEGRVEGGLTILVMLDDRHYQLATFSETTVEPDIGRPSSHSLVNGVECGDEVCLCDWDWSWTT